MFVTDYDRGETRYYCGVTSYFLQALNTDGRGSWFLGPLKVGDVAFHGVIKSVKLADEENYLVNKRNSPPAAFVLCPIIKQIIPTLAGADKIISVFLWKDSA